MSRHSQLFFIQTRGKSHLRPIFFPHTNQKEIIFVGTTHPDGGEAEKPPRPQCYYCVCLFVCCVHNEENVAVTRTQHLDRERDKVILYILSPLSRVLVRNVCTDGGVRKSQRASHIFPRWKVIISSAKAFFCLYRVSQREKDPKALKRGG